MARDQSGTQPMSPTVIRPLTLLALLDHVLAAQPSTAPTTLVVCSTRESFLQQLLGSLRRDDEQHMARRIDPTLHNLFTSRQIKVLFCASVQTVLACLTAYAGSGTPSQSGIERLFLVNPLRLHAHTPSFSAQGLGRAFAAAVEAASRAHAALFIVECVAARVVDSHAGGVDEDTEVARERQDTGSSSEDQDPWEQEVSILNVSARRFGSGNADRTWAGRTVSAQRIAARWCRFHSIQEPSAQHEYD